MKFKILLFFKDWTDNLRSDLGYASVNIDQLRVDFQSENICIKDTVN